MSQEFVINAELRKDQGKGASRRLRRAEDKIPAILYGGKNAPVNLSIPQKDLRKALENEAFYSHVLTINFDGKKESAILKDLQRHPFKAQITHADFQRVLKDHELHVHVPLHFTNEAICKAVKTGGGVISHQLIEVEIVCLPANLPEFIEVDLQNLEMDQILHLSDIKLPKGVRIVALLQGADHDLPVVSVHKPKGSKADADDAAPEADKA